LRVSAINEINYRLYNNPQLKKSIAGDPKSI
jgi:hypothetical protein